MERERLTVISAYGCNGKAARHVCSSSAATSATASCEPTRNDNVWLRAGTPVMGSRRVFRWAMLHDGEIRRSEEALGEVMMRGTSAALWRDAILADGKPNPQCSELGMRVGGLERSPEDGFGFVELPAAAYCMQSFGARVPVWRSCLDGRESGRPWGG